jgi:hypothetical protein
MADAPDFARLRAQLAAQLAPPLSVSTAGKQHYFGEDSAAYCEIEVRHDEAFAVVVVRAGSAPSEGFITRVWHRYADEVWVVDPLDATVQIVPRGGPVQRFAAGDTLRSARLPGIAIPIAAVFALTN